MKGSELRRVNLIRI